jgi:hypothetical protein
MAGEPNLVSFVTLDCIGILDGYSSCCPVIRQSFAIITDVRVEMPHFRSCTPLSLVGVWFVVLWPLSSKSVMCFPTVLCMAETVAQHPTETWMMRSTLEIGYRPMPKYFSIRSLNSANEAHAIASRPRGFT